MGYFLLRESMLDSVLIARDRFLKAGAGCTYYAKPCYTRQYDYKILSYPYVYVVPRYVSFLTSLQSRLRLRPARPMPCYWCIPTSSGHVGWAHASWSVLATCG